MFTAEEARRKMADRKDEVQREQIAAAQAAEQKRSEAKEALRKEKLPELLARIEQGVCEAIHKQYTWAVTTSTGVGDCDSEAALLAELAKEYLVGLGFRVEDDVEPVFSKKASTYSHGLSISWN